MMVKNEEEMLPRCLNSIKHLIDELIIVDTGSTDKTIEIAESFGAKIYHHPWENNFSKHRNQSLRYATGDWIIQIDADEELNGYHFKKNDLKKLFGNARKDLHCFLIKMLDKNKKGETVSKTEMARIFRNHVGVHFTGIVHNRPQYSGKVGHIDIQFFHYGYALSDDQMQAKYKRTSGLLFKRIEMDPQDYDAYFFLYQVHSEMQEKQKAVEYAEQCLGLIKEKKIDPTQSSFYYSLYHGLASIHLKSGQYDLAQSFIRKGLEVLPDEPDLYYDLAAVGFFSGRPELSVEGGKNYLRVIDGFRKDPLKAGTRFIFTASKKAELSVSFWLMLGLISLNQLDAFLALWEKYKEDMLDKSSFQKLLFESLDKNEAFEFLESIAVFLFDKFEKVPVVNHQMIFSFFLFYLKEKELQQKDGCEGLNEMLESVTGRYLDALDSYNAIPTGDAVVIAEILLNKGMGRFFLDLTLILFERELAGQFNVIDSNEIIINGYKQLAEKQENSRRGKLVSLLCLNICKKLIASQANYTPEETLKKLSSNNNADNESVNFAKHPFNSSAGQMIPGTLSQKEHAQQTVQSNSVSVKKDKAPPVTIGLPVFNGGQDLEATIKSILNQDAGDFELLISDNCSTDITEEICKKYADQDRRVYYTRADKNYGLIPNMRAVFGLSKGTFFIFASQDSTYNPRFISICLDELTKDKDQSIEVVFPQINTISAEKWFTPYSDPFDAIHDDPIQRYLHVLHKLDLNNAVLGMMRRSALQENRLLFSSLSSNLLFWNLPLISSIALKGKVKQISQKLIDRRLFDYSHEILQQDIPKLVNKIAPITINDGLTMPFLGIIRMQIEVLKYAAISFDQKDFLINETIKCLKKRYHTPMIQEIGRAVSLVKKRLFFTTWNDQSLPATTLNNLKYYKREYISSLYRDFENALFIFPELSELKEVIDICGNFLKE